MVKKRLGTPVLHYSCYSYTVL